MNYGLIFWGNSLYNSIFKILKTVRIIIGTGTRDSCTELFKILNILPLQSQYILLLMLFVVNNTNKFKINSQIHSINTRNNSTSFNLSHAYLLTKKTLLPWHQGAEWTPPLHYGRIS